MRRNNSIRYFFVVFPSKKFYNTFSLIVITLVAVMKFHTADDFKIFKFLLRRNGRIHFIYNIIALIA